MKVFLVIFWLFLAAIDFAIAAGNFQYHHGFNSAAGWFAALVGGAIFVAAIQMAFTDRCWFDVIFKKWI